MSSLSQSPTTPEMEIQQPALVNDDPSTYSSAMWDWGDLLDFAVDDRLLVSFDSDQTPLSLLSPPPPMIPTEPPAESESYPSPEESGSGSDRVRKRDPRLICSHFLEGMLPCSCPKLDQKLEEAELSKKKRVRGGSGVARCQIVGCETDISDLKGYHKRHRVCLRCAKASFVVLDGENKRYCQQCGKYVLLSVFQLCNFIFEIWLRNLELDLSAENPRRLPSLLSYTSRGLCGGLRLSINSPSQGEMCICHSLTDTIVTVFCIELELFRIVPES